MARTAEITFKEFRRRYNSEDACRVELFRLRFPNGFVCPKLYFPYHSLDPAQAIERILEREKRANNL